MTTRPSSSNHLRICLFMSILLITWQAQSEQVHSQQADDKTTADKTIHPFTSQQLTDVYFSEGIAVGDLNADGINDIVYGPHWYAGPEFTVAKEIYPPVPQDRERYSDHFFAWVYDFDHDGWNDILTVGFPGTPSFVYENPRKDGNDWIKHQVLDWVSNESPQWVNVVGDETPELVCTRDGFFGYAVVNSATPFADWTFYPVSEPMADKRFGHGLGVGDVNGDQLADIIHSQGWFEQPAANPEKGRWVAHSVPFTTAYGGADMFAYDVDGDGDQDVITSDAAHDFGLDWYEQIKGAEGSEFQRHRIMGSHPSENAYGTLFSELHSVALADIDGDGLKDIVTGKTYYSHHRGSPMWDAGAVVTWFRLNRTEDGVDWVPYTINGETGIGRQLVVTDINLDGHLDVAVGGMKGASVLIHQPQVVDDATWLSHQPKPYVGPKLPKSEGAERTRGPKAKLSKANGTAKDAIEGEQLKTKISGGATSVQTMNGFAADKWSANAQLWWNGAKPGDLLECEIRGAEGDDQLQIVMTCARDYAIVQLLVDDQPVGAPVDLYDRQVVTTGVLTWDGLKLNGPHKLGIQIAGANADAQPAYMVGIDWIRVSSSQHVVAPSAEEAETSVGAVDDQGGILNFDFESGDLRNWTAEGLAFSAGPIQGDTVKTRRPDMQSNHQGNYWVGSYERAGDTVVGILTSDPFKVTQPFASFLSNGGSHFETRVELVDNTTDKVFYSISGTNEENLRRVIVDLSDHLGESIRIRLVDQHKGAWGHLNFDDFQFHETSPGTPTPPLVRLVPDEYPHALLGPEDAAKEMQLPDGFRVTVAAAEPIVQQPIAMALDDAGRLWVAEAFEYPVRADGNKGRDRILIFTDKDGDGRFDESKVFIEGLNLVSGLEVGFGGVWVGAAPYLMFIPDRNGDDVPDSEPQILLDGWGYQDTHETLNAFIWGPDGWLYGCHGVFTHSLVGAPGTPKENRQPINAGVWRYHPIEHKFEVFAHGTSNPWGVDFNDYGQAFITSCVIPHLYHMIQGARYERQAGQHFNSHTYRDITTIADHLHYLGNNPHGGNSKSDSAGGGHAHAGAMIYLGNQWPAEYRNKIFMNNIHGQRINMDILQESGSGYVGSHGADFLLTGDRASQILNLRYGPDGNAWMIDWYDMQACHRGEVNAHDRSNGRIYKIIYGESRASSDLRLLTDIELVALTLDPNDWYVRHARKILQYRASQGSLSEVARTKLAELAVRQTDPTRVLRAMWALHVTGGIEAGLAQYLFQHADPHVRAWMVQLRLEHAAESEHAALAESLTALAQRDPAPLVRLYLAAAAQRLPVELRWNLVSALCARTGDDKDHNLPLMLWYAAEPLAEVDPQRALALAMASGDSQPLVRDFMLRRIGSTDNDQAIDVLVAGLGKAQEMALQKTYLQAIRASLRGQRQVAAPDNWAAVYSRLASSTDSEIVLQATALGVTFGDSSAMAAMRNRVADKNEEAEFRKVALQSLLDAKDSALAPSLQNWINDPELSLQALSGLAQYSDPKTPEILIESYQQLNTSGRRAALATLCSRVNYGKALLAAIESKRLQGTDLTADLVRQLHFLRDDELDAMLENVWGSVRESAEDKLALIAEYKKLVQAKGKTAPDLAPDLALGRAVFAQTCAKCHILFGNGNHVGPDLTGSNRADLDYLLSNIVDPSAVMAKEYQPTILITVDGRIVTGLIRAEDENSVTVQSADALVVLPLEEIEERRLGDKSMMPEDQLKQFSPKEIRSLIAYLGGKTQVPMRANAETAGLMFNGKDLSHWSSSDDLWKVDQGEIVGQTSGIDHNNWLISDLEVGDFRFTVDVLLVDNLGNSGIQFRSSATEGEVSGYQADVGAGWWGKLYEEHGRGLLWDKSGETHVAEGQWNTYEIVAVGSKISTSINGELCVELDDPKGARRGIIAFQLHSGGNTEVRFRNLRLEVLDSKLSTPE